MARFGTISKAKIEASYFEWEIPEFPLLLRNDIEFYSPVFPFSGSTWCLRVLPIDTQVGYHWLSVYLEMEKPYNGAKTLIFSLDVKKADGAYVEKVNYHTFKEDDLSSGWDKFFYHADLWNSVSELFPTEALTLKLCISNICPSSEVATLEQSKFVELETLSSDLSDLFIGQKSCDATLKVDGREFQVHRAILTARSSLLASMFENAMSEQETGVVDIPDCDPESFSDFLKYLYSGQLGVVSCVSARNLFVTADKYDVQKLKSICIKYMEQNLSLENFFDVLTLASRYEKRDLLSSVQAFFNENAPQIVCTSKWETTMRSNFRLANKLLKEMFNCKILVSKVVKGDRN